MTISHYIVCLFSPSVLPLTPENVASVFRVVPLTKERDGFLNKVLGKHLGIPEEYHHQPETAARWYVNEGDACWRRIAYYLDRVNETGVSDYIIPYVEPPAGVYTVHEHFALYMYMWGSAHALNPVWLFFKPLHLKPYILISTS